MNTAVVGGKLQSQLLYGGFVDLGYGVGSLTEPTEVPGTRMKALQNSQKFRVRNSQKFRVRNSQKFRVQNSQKFRLRYTNVVPLPRVLRPTKSNRTHRNVGYGYGSLTEL